MANGDENSNFVQDDDRPLRSETVVSRDIAGETILVPIKSTASDLDDIFTLTEVASRTWELIDGTRTIAQIAEIIASEYDVEPTSALEDTRELITRFSEARVLAKGPETPT